MMMEGLATFVRVGAQILLVVGWICSFFVLEVLSGWFQ